MLNIVSRATLPKIQEYLLYILIAFIPFSVRYVFDSPFNFQTGAYSDFTSLSIYISDLIIAALLITTIASRGTTKNTQKPYKLWLYAISGLIVWLVVELVAAQTQYIPLQIYFTCRLIVLLALCVSITKFTVSREKIAWLFVILGSIQSIIATYQFIFQKSVGLYWFGESHLSAATIGVAKIVAHGTTLVRGYGTFPHSNLLAAFLVCATILNLYLITKSYQKSRGIFLYICQFLNVFGIFVSFSRGGMLALFVGIAIFVVILSKIKGISRATQAILPALTATALAITILWPYLESRATVSDNAVLERRFYNQIGLNIALDKPIFGVGAGTSVLHMKQYTDKQLEPWQNQPIHNFYLISWAELGIGAILLIFVILLPIFTLFKGKKSEWNIGLIAIGVGFLGLFMLDHYFYTIWTTQILLWMIIGLSMKECKSYL